MKKLLLVCLLCLIPFLSYASGPQVLATGTCTRDNMRLSTIAGTAFWQCNGVDISAFAGEYIELRDTANKVLRGFAKAAGGGLAYGSDKDVDGITKANPGVVTLAASSAITDGMCVYFSGLTEMTDLNTKYRTVKGTSGDTFQLESTSGYAAAETTGGNCLKQLTVPAATGVTIVSTNGGTTYNWAFTESGFNVNDSSYTYRILSTNIPGKQIASGTVSATDVKLATVDGGSMVDITGLNFSDITDEGWIKKLVPTMWLRAEDLTATLGDGDAVTTWVDKMGSYNATQSTADNKPTLQTAEINGKAVVRFDGSNDYLTTASHINLPSGATFFAVITLGSSALSYYNEIFSDSNVTEANAQLFIITRQTTGQIWSGHVNTSVTRLLQNTKGLSNSSTSIVSFVRTDGTSSALYRSFFNGENVSSTLSGSASVPSTGYGATTIGRNGDQGYYPFHGDIAEIIVFNRALSDAERNQVEKSLSAYYGITLASSNPVPSSFVGVDAYSPPSTNLQLHLKADAGCYTDAGKTTACASDADKVYVWEDQSGNGNDAVQATEGYRPLYKTNIVGTLPSIRFGGTDDYLTLGANSLNITNAVTAYIVTKDNGSAGAYPHYIAINADDSEPKGLDILQFSTTETRMSAADGSGWAGINKGFSFTRTNNNIITFSSNGSLVYGWLNGLSKGPSDTTTGNIGFADSGDTSIGMQFTNGSYQRPLTGDIYEILIYNAAHDGITRTQIERYLAGKWGISYTPTVYGASPAKYLLALYDSSGRVATGYIGASGGGETLGAEIATGTLTAGKLYKITATEANHFYTGCAIGEYFTSVGTETCDASNKVQEVTEVEATGLHGHSTPNATDRKMSLKTTGFNPNAVTKYKIYRTY